MSNEEINELYRRTAPDPIGRSADSPGLPPGIPARLVRFGKATVAWAAGNTVTLDPCLADGTDIPGAANVTGSLISPVGGDPAVDPPVFTPAIAMNDVLAYLAFGSDKGVILNANWQFVAGSNGDMIIRDNALSYLSVGLENDLLKVVDTGGGVLLPQWVTGWTGQIVIVADTGSGVDTHTIDVEGGQIMDYNKT